MPKRIPTPPPADDEPRYLTVANPYPLYADMERESDRVAFVYWMATCIGRNNLYAFFHKPKSPNMVIIEVDRKYRGFDAVLGEHRWSEFLRQPSDDERSKASKVFYCTYSSGREVEKYGWKRVFIKDSWYETPEHKVKWRRLNDIIKYPYPFTHRCDVPAEDKTREPLCRPLPTRAFPLPPPVRPPAVGTPEWMKAKEANSSVHKARPVANAWSNGAPQSMKTIQAAALAGERPEVPGVSLGVIDMAGWARGPSLPPGLAVLSGQSSSAAPSTVLAPSRLPSGLEHKHEAVHTDLGSAIHAESADDTGEDSDDWCTPMAVAEQARVVEPFVPPQEISDPQAPTELTNLWEGYESDARIADEWICPEHRKCKPSTCKIHAERVKEERTRRKENRLADIAQGNRQRTVTGEGDWRVAGRRRGTADKDRPRREDSKHDDESGSGPKDIVVPSKRTASPSAPFTGRIPAKPARLLNNKNAVQPPAVIPPRPARLINRETSKAGMSTAMIPGAKQTGDASAEAPAHSGVLQDATTHGLRNHDAHSVASTSTPMAEYLHETDPQIKDDEEHKDKVPPKRRWADEMEVEDARSTLDIPF